MADALAYFDTLANQDQSMVPISPGKRITHDSFSMGETLVSLQEYRSGVSPNFRVTWQSLPIPSFDPDNRLTTLS